MNETNIVREIQIAASRIGARLIRQQTGMGWIGKGKRKPDGTVIIPNARPFHSGFTGWSDTGGFTPVLITPDMVGQTVAVYTQVEVKTDTGPVRTEQRDWISYVRSQGARAGIARSPDDVIRILRGEVLD